MVEQEGHWLAQARRAVFEVYRRQGNSAWIEARGNSMRPLISPGTWMLVEFGAMPIGVGEIVLFSRGELLVAHRLIAWRSQQGTPLLVTKGDAELYADPPLRLTDVIGVVRALRCSPTEPVTGVGCSGRLAFIVAQISSWGGRGAALARRAAIRLPDPLRRVVLRTIPLYIWVATQVLLAPFGWRGYKPYVLFYTVAKR